MKNNSIQIINVAKNITVFILLACFVNYIVSYYFSISISQVFLYSSIVLMSIGILSWIMNMKGRKRNTSEPSIKFNFREPNFGQGKIGNSKHNNLDFMLFMVVTGAILFFIASIIK